MAIDTTREQLDYTPHQARNTTLAGLVCLQTLLVTATPLAAIEGVTVTDLWEVDTTDGSVTMTLPPLAEVPLGRRFLFYKTVAANSMIVEGNGSETIEGSADITRTAQYAMLEISKVETASGTWAWALTKSAVPDGDLVSTNNLSDLDDDAAARGNLGIVQLITFQDLDLVGANTAVWQYVHPALAPDATIVEIDTVLSDALTTGNATITAAINGTPVTDGVVTITQAGSATGDVDSTSPSAANVITGGDVVTLTVGGTNDAAETANGTLLITY